ncbi:MAG: HEPN domain-containing protein [Terracidiphilus sp.]
MKKKDGKQSRSGKFTLNTQNEVYGELKIDGEASSLYVHDKEYFTPAIPDRCIKGELHDLTKVTLIDCVAPPVPGSYSRGEEGYHFAEIFPHYVVQGDRHIDPNEKIIDEVSFLVDDAGTLFSDFDAFGSVLDARPFIDEIVKAHVPNRRVETGDDARLIYFTGKTNISTVETVYGKVSVDRRPGFDFGGAGGAYIQNKVVISIRFHTGLAFHEALSRASVLIDYLGMLVGRPQNLIALGLRIGIETDSPAALDVDWSWAPKRDKSIESSQPDSFDVMVDAVRAPTEFANVLKNWLERQEAWHGARWRFFRSFEKQRHYDPDRLIGAANMFDILPSSAVPSDIALTEELSRAQIASRAMFRDLPQSPERDSVLGALGRLGKSSLKHKVRYRAQKLLDVATEWAPEFFKVTDAAVNCRNYYVHGTEPQFDYDRNFDLVTFFTDTLEFVFAASDLVEAGWDLKSWMTQGTTMSHPFGRYRVNYRIGLKRLAEALSNAKAPA